MENEIDFICKDYENGTTIIIQTIEDNKDKVICCPEQIAYYKNWINKEQLAERAKILSKNNYGKYLQKVVDETK